ncbi:MAG TPA: hypothetical protein VGH11_11210 [Jatrophihabitans sp.]|jgi:hypothetical protein
MADTDLDEAASPASASAGRQVLVGVGALLYLLAGVGAGVFETLLVPVRHGTTYIPISVVLAAITNALLIWLARQLNGSGAIAALPLIGWTIVFVVMGVTGPGGDVLVQAGNEMQWIALAMVLVGLLSGIATLARTGSRSRLASRARPQVGSIR